MRAGLLSDARVIAILRRHFVPCMISALNTRDLLADAGDAALLEGSGRADTFQGGEREAFVLPDGRMLDVFLSLHGPSRNGSAHYTAAGRRSDAAVAPFRAHAERALRAVHGELPPDWDALWRGDDDDVRRLQLAEPAWPLPAAGTAALRVFVRNSYKMYDALAGCELVAVDDGLAARLCAGLDAVGDRERLPPELFAALARAMVPRGQVAGCLLADSIAGEVELVVERADGDRRCGRVEGWFALRPKDKAEVGRRPPAACLFRSSGRLRGVFTLDRATRRVRDLRLVSEGVELWWDGRWRDDGWVAPQHDVAVEWVAGPASPDHAR